MSDTISASAGLASPTAGPAFIGTAPTGENLVESGVHIGGAAQIANDPAPAIFQFGTFAPDLPGAFSVVLTDPTAPAAAGASISVPMGVASFVIDFATLVSGGGDSDRG